MNLAYFLQPHHIVIGAKETSKEQAIQHLVALITAERPGLDRTALLEKILDRETISSTTLENGLAFPHARIDNYNDLTISVLIPVEPIKDGDKVIRILFLIITDQTKSNLYLNVMSGIAQLGQNEDFLTYILGALSPKDCIRRVESCNFTIRRTIIVKDIMNAAFPPLLPSTSLKEALDTIVKTQEPYLPVCNESNEFIGEVTIYDIITIGMPQYTHMMKNLSFLQTLEPMEDLLKRESSIELRSIMHKPSVVLMPETAIVEAIFLFVKHPHRSFLPVVESGQFRGVLSYLDLVNKFLRI